MYSQQPKKTDTVSNAPTKGMFAPQPFVTSPKKAQPSLQVDLTQAIPATDDIFRPSKVIQMTPEKHFVSAVQEFCESQSRLKQIASTQVTTENNQTHPSAKPSQEFANLFSSVFSTRKQTTNTQVKGHENNKDLVLVESLIQVLKAYDQDSSIEEKLKSMETIMAKARQLAPNAQTIAGFNKLNDAIKINTLYLQKNEKIFHFVDKKTQEIANAYLEEMNKYRLAVAQRRMNIMPPGLQDKIEKGKEPNKIRGHILQLIDGIELDTTSLEVAELLLVNLRKLPFKYTGNDTSGKSILEGNSQGDCRTLCDAMCIILKDFFEINSQLISINEQIVCVNKPILGRNFDPNQGLLLFNNHHWVVVAGKEFDPLFGSSLTQEERIVVQGDNKKQVEDFIDLHGKTDIEKQRIKQRLHLL